MIELTKNEVEGKYNRAAGAEHDAVVIYGDTDSVMVKFGVDTVAEGEIQLHELPREIRQIAFCDARPEAHTQR